MRRRRLGAAGLALGAVLLAGCRSSRPIRPAPPASPILDLPASEPASGIRVGVVMGAARVSVSAPSGVRMWREGGGVWDLPRVTAEALGAPSVSLAFAVQIANVSSAEAAGPVVARARATSTGSVSVEPGGGGFRVRVGPFPGRSAAERARRTLASAGFPDAWVTSVGAAASGGRLRAHGVEAASLLILPLRESDLIAVEGVRYRGRVTLRPAPGGGVDAVNTLNLEEYLRGVVPRELSPSVFPELEALKAQAVAARTYAIRHLGGFGKRGFDLCATPACQVYGGADAEQPLSDRAVEETRGLVVLYGGRPIDALYTSTCGGHTENAENIFSAGDPAPWLRGVACTAERATRIELQAAVATDGPARDRGSRHHAWRVTLTPEQVAEEAAGLGWSGTILDVAPERRGVSGRIVEVRLVGPGRERRVRGLNVRRALGLRESPLAIERDRGPDGRVVRFHFTGRGWGHGVGLCQVGAVGMATAGRPYDAILRHYYTGITLGPRPRD